MNVSLIEVLIYNGASPFIIYFKRISIEHKWQIYYKYMIYNNTTWLVVAGHPVYESL